MIRAIRSIVAGMRAARRLGRASKLHDLGRKEEALSVAREALDLLAAPYVNRANPPEGSALVGITVLVEELASDLGVAGAEHRDLSDTLGFLKQLRGDAGEYERWIPYLEQRLSQGAPGAV